MSRPKGYAKWEPRPETLQVIRQVQVILDEYRDHLPLTVRQVFYRLVGAYDYDKTEKAYARLCEYLVRARRAQMLPFEHIRDDGTIKREPWWHVDGPDSFWKQVGKDADDYSRDQLAEQPVHIELWCEAAGMVPQLVRVAQPYSVPVYSTGGFSSVTVTYEIAERALKRDKPTVFLHVGDYDPSGESIFEAMTEDARQFLYNRLVWKLERAVESAEPDERNAAKLALETNWPSKNLYPQGKMLGWLPDLRPERVALTADQVDEYDLPTAPPKASDTRSASWVGETCQCEALPPDVLASVVEAAILAQLDPGILERVREEEDLEGSEIRDKVREIREGIGG